jgi:hypothetical protein
MVYLPWLPNLTLCSPTVTCVTFALISDIWTSAILESFRLSYGIKNYGTEGMFNVTTSVLDFMKIYQLVDKLLEGDTQTDRQHGDLISSFIILMEVYRYTSQ